MLLICTDSTMGPSLLVFVTLQGFGATSDMPGKMPCDSHGKTVCTRLEKCVRRD